MKAVVRWMGSWGRGWCSVRPAGGRRDDRRVPNGYERTGANPVIEIWKAQRKMELRQGGALIGRVSRRARPAAARRQGDAGRRPHAGRPLLHLATRIRPAASTAFSASATPTSTTRSAAISSGLIDAGAVGRHLPRQPARRRAALRTPRSAAGSASTATAGGPYVPVDWTEGCIAVSDDDIEFIYDRVPVGTPVIINE